MLIVLATFCQAGRHRYVLHGKADLRVSELFLEVALLRLSLFHQIFSKFYFIGLVLLNKSDFLTREGDGRN